VIAVTSSASDKSTPLLHAVYAMFAGA
jgi:hypothetical protein